MTTIEFPKGKLTAAEQQKIARGDATTIMDMEEPLRSLGQLVNGIYALCENSTGTTLPACRTLAFAADTLIDRLRQIWEGSVELGRGGGQ